MLHGYPHNATYIFLSRTKMKNRFKTKIVSEPKKKVDKKIC